MTSASWLSPLGADEHIDIPDIGLSASSIISPAQEQRLGRDFIRAVNAQLDVVTDEVLTEYIKGLGFRLAEKSTRPELHFNFFLINSPQVNAFAGPYGYIGINTGLFLLSESESELASVMAHEIAHVTQRHLLRAIEKSQQLSLPTIAASLGAIILASQNPDAGFAALTAVQAANQQLQINFTRSNEEEADRFGMRVLSDAAFDPRAMPGFFEKMNRQNYSGHIVPEYLRTHPLTPNRISEARDRAADFSYKQYPNSDDYLHMHARIRAMYSPLSNDEVTAFAERLDKKKYRNEAAERYGYAVALLRTGNHSEAKTQVGQLLDTNPGYIPYVLLSADVHRATKRNDLAIGEYQRVLVKYPGSALASTLLAETLINDQQFTEARKLLMTLKRKAPESASIYQLLAQCEAALGNTVDAYRMRAEYFYLLGDVPSAIQQLVFASKVEAIDFFQLSKVESRLKALRAEAPPVSQQRPR